MNINVDNTLTKGYFYKLFMFDLLKKKSNINERSSEKNYLFHKVLQIYL